MKTTMDLPDDLLKRVKARAARRGQTMTSFLRTALEAKLLAEEAAEREKPWMNFFGVHRDAGDSSRILTRIEEECGQVDPEEWT